MVATLCIHIPVSLGQRSCTTNLFAPSLAPPFFLSSAPRHRDALHHGSLLISIALISTYPRAFPISSMRFSGSSREWGL